MSAIKLASFLIALQVAMMASAVPASDVMYCNDYNVSRPIGYTVQFRSIRVDEIANQNVTHSESDSAVMSHVTLGNHYISTHAFLIVVTC
ncbi:hypothetical protein JOM56_007025 [Amanita muscaria]